MKQEKRRLLFNWCSAHDELKQSVENGGNPGEDSEIGNHRGWTYFTFLSGDAREQQMIFDVSHILRLAQDNSYHLPEEVVAEHNKIVLTASPENGHRVSLLPQLYEILASYATQFDDATRYPSHGLYGKFGGIYTRPEKGRVLALYSSNDEALLEIFEALEKLVAQVRPDGFTLGLHLSNGLSVLPRMLHGYDDPKYRRSGVKDYRIIDPARFEVLLEQAQRDHHMYLFNETWD